MADLRNTIDSGAHGSVVTSASTAYAGGTQLTIGGTGTIPVTWDAGEKIGGAASIKIQPLASGQSRYVELATSDASTSASAVGYFRLTAHPANAPQVMMQITQSSGASSLATCEVSPDGTVRFRSMGVDVGAASSAKVATGQWYRVELAVRTGAAGSSLVSGKISPGTSTTALHSVSSTSIGMSGATVSSVRLGSCIAGAQSNAFEQHIDCIRIVTGSTTLLGAWLGDAAPVVDPDSFTDPGLAIGYLADQTRAALASLRTQIGTGSGGGTTPVANTDFAAIITN